MAKFKFIVTPGKALGEAPTTVKGTYITLLVISAVNLIDAFLEGGLTGLYVGMTGFWSIVLAMFVSYLVYDVGNTIIRKRKTAANIGYGLAAGFIGVGLWNLLSNGLYSSFVIISLSVVLVVFLSLPASKEYVLKK
jgi:hypothetical protein